MDRISLDGCLVERLGLGLDARPDSTTPGDPPRHRGIGSRVAPLIAAELGLAAVFVGLSVHARQLVGRPATIVLFAFAFACAGAFNMRLEFRRHQFTFTLADAVLTASFFALGPIGIAIAAAVGEGASLGIQRVAPLKTLYNIGNRLASAVVAGEAFVVLGHTRIGDGAAWGAAILAALCFASVDTIFTASALATVERSRFGTMLASSTPTAALTTLAAAPLGVIAWILSSHSMFAPLLLVPLIAAVMLNSRHAAAQRDEHLRFERLHEASSRTAHVVDLEDALHLLAVEANGLATGLGAICCTTDADEEWIGVVADDTLWHRASPAVIEELLRLVDGTDGLEVSLDPSTPALNGIAPAAQSVVVARVSPDQAAPIAIAVLREGTPDIGAPTRVQTLGAFANHASLTTANARLYAELESALARQIDLNRQKGDFVAAVSHELRTPLAVMLAANHTLRKLADRIPEAKRLELLDASIEQGNRLQRLIDELLLVAAAEHDHPEVVETTTELAPLVEEIEREMRPTTQGRLVVVEHDPAGLVTADPARLRQILLNLVDNASKYAPDGPIELHVTRQADDVRLALVDHGPGIPEADRARVFDQFVQLDQSSTRRQGGTGLGLYLCRQLATLLNGTLTLEPVPDGGCCFTLMIKAAAAGAVDDQPPTPPVPPDPPSSESEKEQRFASVRTRPAEFARRPAPTAVPTPRATPEALLPVE
jgi:signal transduction histidine kinase